MALLAPQTMKLRMLPLLCLVFLAACSPQVTSTPMRPPTSVPRTELVPTSLPDPFARPEVTILGELEGGIPFGITADGHAFKGDPEAPVIMVEFSDYQ